MSAIVLTSVSSARWVSFGRQCLSQLTTSFSARPHQTASTRAGQERERWGEALFAVLRSVHAVSDSTLVLLASLSVSQALGYS